jgi:hypothetical protein
MTRLAVSVLELKGLSPLNNGPCRVSQEKVINRSNGLTSAYSGGLDALSRSA